MLRVLLKVGGSLSGSLGRWVVGLLGTLVGGSLGRWVVGLLGTLVGGSLGRVPWYIFQSTLEYIPRNYSASRVPWYIFQGTCQPW